MTSRTTRILFLLMIPVVIYTLFGREIFIPRPSHRFAIGTDHDQFAELWLPSGPGPHKVLVFIHGGCWLAQIEGLKQLASVNEDLRKNGIAVWNIEYRRLWNEGAGYPGTYMDVANAIDYLREIAPKYNLDISHLVVMGHSAGGHLALWAAARNRIPKDSPLYLENPLPVSTVVSLAGVGDLEKFHDQAGRVCAGTAVIDGMAHRPDGPPGKNSYSDTSPQMMLPLGVTQLLVYSSADLTVPLWFSESYIKAAKASGDKVEVLTMDYARHLDLINSSTPAWKSIREHLLPYFK